MPGPDDIEAHRQAVLQRWADSPRHSWIGLHAEYASARDVRGIVFDADGEEVRLPMQRLGVRDIMERVFPTPKVRLPFRGANRAQRRAAEAKAKRRA